MKARYRYVALQDEIITASRLGQASLVKHKQGLNMGAGGSRQVVSREHLNMGERTSEPSQGRSIVGVKRERQISGEFNPSRMATQDSGPPRMSERLITQLRNAIDFSSEEARRCFRFEGYERGFREDLYRSIVRKSTRSSNLFKFFSR